MIINHIKETIGNTPLLKLDKKVHKLKNVNIYAKLELLNPYGSLKDRVALNILDLKKSKGKTVIESSSGNTAKALSSLCSLEGLKFKTITNRIKQPEIRQILKVMGAEIEELPGHSECPDPNDPNDPIKVIEDEISKNPNKYFHTDQYFNKKNIEAHENSGREIAKDLKKVDYFFGYLGTCGSSVGIGNILKKKCDTKCIGIVTGEGEYVPGGRSENELYETGFYKEKFYEDTIKGTIKESIKGMLDLNRKYGIPCGPTSGLTYSSMVEYLSKFKFKKEVNVVFIVCDRLEPYMSYIQKYDNEIFKNNSKNENLNLDINYNEVLNAPEIEYKKIPKNAILIDIRSNYSFNFNSLPNSININSYLFEDLLKQKNVFPKNKPLVLICPKGYISKRYIIHLRKEGYKAYSLKGGILNVKL